MYPARLSVYRSQDSQPLRQRSRTDRFGGCFVKEQKLRNESKTEWWSPAKEILRGIFYVRKALQRLEKSLAKDYSKERNHHRRRIKWRGLTLTDRFCFDSSHFQCCFYLKIQRRFLKQGAKQSVLDGGTDRRFRLLPFWWSIFPKNAGTRAFDEGRLVGKSHNKVQYFLFLLLDINNPIVQP